MAEDMDVESRSIPDVERDINEVQGEIKEVTLQLSKEEDPGERQRLCRREEQLRTEKEQLRNEKEQLRKKVLLDKELLLLKFSKEVPPATAPQAPPDYVSSFWTSLKKAQTKTEQHNLDTQLVTSALRRGVTPANTASSSTWALRKRKRTRPTVAVDCQVLRLLDGATFLNTDHTPLFIREVYEDLMKTALEILKGSFKKRGKSGSPLTVRHMIVTGSPGMGKTMWGFYLLYKLVKEHPDQVFIWENLSMGESYYFHGGEVCIGRPGDFDNRINRNTVFLVNGSVLRAVQVNGHIFMFYSSKDVVDATWQGFKDVPNMHMVYMPPWDLCELVAAAKVTDEKREVWSIREAYKKFGGSARFVLSQFRDNEWTVKFDTALAGVREKAMAKFQVGNMLQAKDSSSFIFHLHVLNGEYTQTVVKFASDHVEQRISELAEVDDTRAMVEYLDRHLHDTIEAPAVGKIFELLVHKVFKRRDISEIKFGVRTMGSRKVSKLTFQLDGKAGGHFSNLEDIQQGSEGYFWPGSDKHPVYDSLIVQGKTVIALQIITKNRNHKPVIMAYVEDLLDRFEKVEFFYVVPEKLFADFPTQRIQDGGKTCEWPPEVRVCFLSIPFDTLPPS